MRDLPFTQAVMMGLADDGGLLVPEQLPDFSDELDQLSALGYAELAARLMAPFVDDLEEIQLRRILAESYAPEVFPDEVAPVVEIDGIHVVELFHGPTLAFKDVALQFLGRLFDHILARDDQRLNVLAATSGDTGSAAIHGLRGRQRMAVFVMHPRGRIAPLQELQMTTVLDDNVHNLAIDGSFDDCQRLLKTLSGDLDFKRRMALGAVNSVNWARILAQMVYYFRAWFEVRERTGASRVRFVVPTGNFGNVLAGWYAAASGLPVHELVVASNANDILPRFFQTGVYARGDVHATLSPAMDIQVASNFERYLYHAVGGRRTAQLMRDFESGGRLALPPEQRADFRAAACSDEQILTTLRDTYERTGYLLDPHSAVGYKVARDLADDVPTVTLATAHPGKFPEAVQQALGSAEAARHPRLDALWGKPTRRHDLPNDPASVRDFIERAQNRAAQPA